MATITERKRISISDFYKMAQAGELSPQDRVELLDGEIRPMSPIGARHMKMVNLLNRYLVFLVGESAIVSVQNPAILNDYSEPQPDVAVFRDAPDFYEQQKPRSEDVLLLIEVADSSLAYDRNIKLPQYAEAGIPEVWIVNIIPGDECVEQYTGPSEGKYASKNVYLSCETLVSSALPIAVKLPLKSLFLQRDL